MSSASIILFLLCVNLITNSFGQSIGFGNGFGLGGLGMNGLGLGSISPNFPANNLANNFGTGLANNFNSVNNIGLNSLGGNNLQMPGISGVPPLGYGDVAVIGELPVDGNTAVTGNVPVIGYVNFEGIVPAGGIVSVANGNRDCNRLLY